MLTQHITLLLLTQHVQLSSAAVDMADGSSRGAWALLRLIQCIRGPKLRRLVLEGRNAEVTLKRPRCALIRLISHFFQGRQYEPNNMERYADNVIRAVSIVYMWLLKERLASRAIGCFTCYLSKGSCTVVHCCVCYSTLPGLLLHSLW